MANKIFLDPKAMAQILKVNMRKPVEEAANAIAAQVDVGSVNDAKVTVKMYETDRAHAVVAIAHPAGIAMELKHGTLRKAAASQGFEIHDSKKKKSK